MENKTTYRTVSRGREVMHSAEQYLHPRVSKEEMKKDMRSEHQKEMGIESVRDAVLHHMRSNPYVDIRKILADKNPARRIKALHHARGTKLLQSGSDVLELDMAGSGYTEFPHEYAGAEDKRRRYGTPYMNREHILMKNRIGMLGREKRRITMAGPQAMWGMSNTGEYSIENLRGYMLAAAREYLDSKFERWEAGEAAPHPIRIIIRGHSRGAVAAAQGAKMIKYWLRKESGYTQYEQYVKFELIQYDPVPGFGSDSGVNKEIDLKQEDEGNKMAGLGREAETTVFYSLRTDHKFFFAPQSVHGAKRVILTPFKHSVGLEQKDTTQNNKDGEGTRHRGAFTDARTGQVYRNSGLSELEKGVYIVDERNILICIPSPGQAEAIINQVVPGFSTQNERRGRILEVVKAWFRANSG